MPTLAATATIPTSATPRSSELPSVPADSELVQGLKRMMALAAMVERDGPEGLTGNTVKVENFCNDMWCAVSTGNVSAGDAAIVQHGLKGGFTFGIKHQDIKGIHVRPNYTSAEEHRGLVDKALSKRLASGKTLHIGKITKGWRAIVTTMLGPDWKCFSLGAVMKKSVDPEAEPDARPISDHTASKLNGVVFIKWLAYTCTSFADFKKELKPNYYSAISDIMDAFLILLIRPYLWRFFMFRWYGQTEATRHETHLYAHLFGDFGCAGVPATFDVFMRVVIGMARDAGALTHPLTIHVDDTAITGPDEVLVNAEQVSFADYLENRLGIYIKRAKWLDAAQRQLYIGLIWNSVSRTLTLPEEKLREYLITLMAFVGSRNASRHEAESLAGKLVRGCLTLPPGANCLLANLWAFVRGLKWPSTRRRTTRALARDLLDVADLLQANQGRGFFAYDLFGRAPQVVSDACTSRKHAAGSWACADGDYKFQPYGTSASRQPIDVLEADMVVDAAAHVAPKYKGMIIPFGIDNSAFQLSAAKGWSRAPRLQVFVKRLFLLAIDNNCVFEFEWWSSHENLLADLLTRKGEVEFLAILEPSGFLWDHAVIRRHPDTGKVRRFTEPRPPLPDTTSVEPCMDQLRQVDKEFSSNYTGDGPSSRGFFTKRATVTYPPVSMYEGLGDLECAEIDTVMNRYAASSHRSMNAARDKWYAFLEYRRTTSGDDWDRLILSGDPLRGTKACAFVRYLMTDTDLTWASIENHIWGWVTWHILKRQADPTLSIVGWDKFIKGVMVLTAVPREPRAELPLTVLEDALRAVNLDEYWEVQSAFVMLITFFTAVRSETPLAKTYAGGKEPFDASAHWVVDDFKFETDPEPHLKVRLKDIKQSTAEERMGSAEDDWILLGLIPESYMGGIWSLRLWYTRLMTFFPAGRPDKSAPMFLDKNRKRWYLYSNALYDMRILWLRGTPTLVWTAYGIHGIRVLAYNLGVEGVGELLMACHGRWATGKSLVALDRGAGGVTHRQYLRFDIYQILLIPFAMLGLVEPRVVEQPSTALAPLRTRAKQLMLAALPLAPLRGTTRRLRLTGGPSTPQAPREEDLASDDDDEYDVEALLDKRTIEGSAEYLVRWAGYGSGDDTWEPEDNIFDKELIASYEATVFDDLLHSDTGMYALQPATPPSATTRLRAPGTGRVTRRTAARA